MRASLARHRSCHSSVVGGCLTDASALPTYVVTRLLVPVPFGVTRFTSPALGYWWLSLRAVSVGSKSGFTELEVQEIKRLYLDEGRSYSQIAKIIGKGSENSVRNALVKARVSRSSGGPKKLERFKPGQKYGRITLMKQLVKSKKLRYHVACDCGYEFDVDPYLLTLAEDHKNSVSMCPQCKAGR